jgi:predicted HD superfamily hydrolase involved in NAD metabolism
MSLHPLLAGLVEGYSLQGSLPERVTAFLSHHGLSHTLVHSRTVARTASLLAVQFAADPVQAESAAWLHDISAVLPNALRVDAAHQLGLTVLPEEEMNPVVLHQKLSRAMAEQIFVVDDPVVLSSIECHTTLKPGAGLVDKILFVADKVSWDQPGVPPYLGEIETAVKISLEKAALVYLRSLWERRAALSGPLHPWALAALQELEALS